ncbi:DNA alkylation repair protein [Candidatus Woesearchaeota archaeon]|nr:DNA alkylation repair protein [Candidatus Woesearchaeota archaeon]
MTAQAIIDELRKRANPSRALVLSRFFKTGKGQYGEGDVFLGVTVPETRQIVKMHSASLQDIDVLLRSRIHECRKIRWSEWFKTCRINFL